MNSGNTLTDIFENSYLPKSTKAINRPLRAINHLKQSETSHGFEKLTNQLSIKLVQVSHVSYVYVS